MADLQLPSFCAGQGVTRALSEQAPRLASLRAVSQFSPRAGCFTEEFSHGHPTSPHPNLLFADVGWLQRSWPGTDMCKRVGQEGLEAASFLRDTLCQITPQSALGGEGARGPLPKLTAHSLVQSECPLVQGSSCQAH